jgi:hypothetical protein
MKLPAPNVDFSRAKYLNDHNTARDEELDRVFKDKIQELKGYLERHE